MSKYIYIYIAVKNVYKQKVYRSGQEREELKSILPKSLLDFYKVLTQIHSG